MDGAPTRSNDWRDELQGSPQQKNTHGKRSEQRLATAMSMTPTRASGAMDFEKGDATFAANINGVDMFGRLECKSTTSASMSVKKDWLDKIHSESIARGEIPLFSISFVDADGNARDANSDWVAMPVHIMNEILGGGGQ